MNWYRWKLWRIAWGWNTGDATIDGKGNVWRRLIGHLHWRLNPPRRNDDVAYTNYREARAAYLKLPPDPDAPWIDPASL